MNTSTINTVTPVQEVEAIISLIKSSLKEFEKDLERKVVDIQSSTGLRYDYELRQVEGFERFEGISEAGLILLREKLGVDKEISDSDHRGDLRGVATSWDWYETGVPFLNLEVFQNEDRSGYINGAISLVIDYSFGQQTTEHEVEIKVDVKSINRKIEDELSIILPQVNLLGLSEVFVISTEHFSGEQMLRVREGLSPALEFALMKKIGARELDSEHMQYDEDTNVTLKRFQTDVLDLYASEEYNDGVTTVRLTRSLMPPSLEFKTKPSDEFNEDLGEIRGRRMRNRRVSV